MPIGPFPDFAACQAHMEPKYGAEGAKKVCGAMEAQMKAKSEEGFEFTELPVEAQTAWIDAFAEAIQKNDETGSARIAWATTLRHYERTVNGKWVPMKVFSDVKFKSILKEDRIIYGAASVAIVDSDNEMITEEALKMAFKSYVERGHVLFFHRNIPVGEVLPNYKMRDGTDLISGVKDGKLNIVVKLYKDTQIANEVWGSIEKGELRSFSIGGQVIGEPVKVCPTEDTCYNRIDRIDLHEISIVPNPANDASYFTVIKSKVESKDLLPLEKKLRAIEKITNSEWAKARNCPQYTDKVLEIIRKQDTTGQNATGGCADGWHQDDDGDCVPDTSEAKSMTTEEKKEVPKPEEKKEEKKVEPAPVAAPAPTVAPAVGPVKAELDAVRAQIEALKGAMGTIAAATKEIAGLKQSLIESPAAKDAAETQLRETGQKVSFLGNDHPLYETVDWTTRFDNSKSLDFEKRMAVMSAEFGATDIKKPKETTAGENPEVPKTDLETIQSSVLDLTKSLKATMAEIQGLKQKAEVNQVQAQIAELKDVIGAYGKEVSSLKDTMSKVPAAKIAAPAEKRTIAIDVTNDPAPFDAVISMDSSGNTDFERRKRRMEKEYGLNTQ